MQGWIKLHRKAQDNPVSTNLELFGLFSFFLMKANHTVGSFFLGQQKIDLEPGQFVWSMQGIADRFSISKPKAYRLTELLEKSQIVIRKGYSKYTLFTIVNRQSYQQEGNTIVTTSDTPPYTNKNDKKKKEGKEVIDFTPPTLLDVESYLSSKGYNKTLAAKFFDYFEEAKRHIKGGKKMENWRKAVSGRYDDRYIIKYTRDELIKIAEGLMKAKQDGGPEAVVKYKEEWGVELCKKAVIEYNTKPKNQR